MIVVVVQFMRLMLVRMVVIWPLLEGQGQVLTL
jgi:hypothetical protein